MSHYQVVASGCDDASKALVELDDTELTAVVRVARAVNAASDYGCQPTVLVLAVTDGPDPECTECGGKGGEYCCVSLGPNLAKQPT